MALVLFETVLACLSTPRTPGIVWGVSDLLYCVGLYVVTCTDKRARKKVKLPNLSLPRRLVPATIGTSG